MIGADLQQLQHTLLMLLISRLRCWQRADQVFPSVQGQRVPSGRAVSATTQVSVL